MFMLRTELWTVERRAGEAFFRAVRSAARGTTEAHQRDAQAFAKQLGGVNTARLGIFIDMSAAGMRNDAEFEATLALLWRVLIGRFGRVAVVLGTPAGRLQGLRLSQELAITPRMFSDEESAIEWLNSPG